jgi:hypothetical protein
LALSIFSKAKRLRSIADNCCGSSTEFILGRDKGDGASIGGLSNLFNISFSGENAV